MRALIQPFVVMSIDTDETYGAGKTQAHRIRLFKGQATSRGLEVEVVSGFYNGVHETAVIVATNSEADERAAEDLGRMWDQEYVCVVNSDASAYQVDLNKGSITFKGYWKLVPSWRVERMLRDGGGYTKTMGCNPKYYVVGS